MAQKTNVDSSKNFLKTLKLTTQNLWVLAIFSSVAVFPVTVVFVIQSALAQASVPVYSALKLYGNAVNSGLCKTLGPTTQNLWVCELTNSNPDVHLTFNDKTLLHITVRTPRGKPTCEGKSWIVGNWPRGLVLNQHQKTEICKVNVVRYIDRLNSVPEKFTDCKEAFDKALEKGKISARVHNSYVKKCRDFRP
jgi:hypothetical protein